MTQSKVLNVPLFGQRTDEWCWAASTEMIANYHNITVLQGESANYCFRQTDCVQNKIADIPPACAQANGMSGIIENFEHWGFSVDSNINAPSFEQVKAQINNKMPFLYVWYWLTQGGHAMIVRGYLEDTITIKGVPTSVQLVLINDPWGNTTVDTYREYKKALPGDVAWLPYNDWISESSQTTQDETKAKQEEESLNISTEQDIVLWTGHIFGEYIYNIKYTKGTVGSVIKSEVSPPIENAKTKGNSGNIGSDIPGELATGVLDSLPAMMKSADPEADIDDNDKLILGEPLSIHYIGHDSLQSYNGEDSVEGLLKEGAELMYPVYKGENSVSSIVVAKRKDVWTLKSIGRRVLTNTIVSARDLHVEKNKKTKSDYFVIHVPSMYCIFVAYRENGKLKFIHTRDHEEYGFKAHQTQMGDDTIRAISQGDEVHPRGLIQER